MDGAEVMARLSGQAQSMARSIGQHDNGRQRQSRRPGGEGAAPSGASRSPCAGARTRWFSNGLDPGRESLRGDRDGYGPTRHCVPRTRRRRPRRRARGTARVARRRNGLGVTAEASTATGTCGWRGQAARRRHRGAPADRPEGTCCARHDAHHLRRTGPTGSAPCTRKPLAVCSRRAHNRSASARSGAIARAVRPRLLEVR